MPKRRANNEGSIWFNEKKQLWNAAITTPAGNRPTKASKDKQIVTDWLNEQRLLVGRNKHVEPNKLTLFDWLKQWLEVYKKNSVSPRTYDRYVSSAKHFSPLYQKRITAITPMDIQIIYNDMLNDYEPQTIKHAHNCINGCFKQAIENRYVHDNPAAKAKLPKIQRKEIFIYNEDEIKAFLEAAEIFRNSVIVRLTYSTGLRLSEVLGLRCEDIKLSGKNYTLTVNQTVHTAKDVGTYYSDTKNKSSHRTISIPKSLYTEIEKHKVKEGIRTGLLFLNTKKTGETPSNYLKKVFSPIIDKAVELLEEKYKKLKNKPPILLKEREKPFHGFRHTHATELLALGVPIHDVARRLGHSKVTTTLNTYAHFMPNSEEIMLSAVSSLLKKK